MLARSRCGTLFSNFAARCHSTVGVYVKEVFISYAREDREHAHAVADALQKQGYTVWWDWKIVGGADFRTEIGKALERSEKVIVLWSKQSIRSAFVIDEASEAKKTGKLVPLSIDGSSPPFGFGNLHTISIEDLAAGIGSVVAALEDKPSPEPHARKQSRRLPAWALLGGSVALVILLAGYFALASLTKVDMKVTRKAGTDSESSVEISAARGVAPSPPKAVKSTLRLALVIGNSEYRLLSKLVNPLNDANKVAQALQDKGFRVIKRLNLDRQQLIDEIKGFQKLLALGGVGIIYYAGSATYSAGQDYILPVDAPYPKAVGDYEQNFVNLTQLMAPVDKLIEQQSQSNGAIRFYSASERQLASDGPPGQNSPFTAAFLDAIVKPQLEFGDVIKRVTRSVRDESNGRQIPTTSSDSDVPFFFDRSEEDAKIGILKIVILDSCRDDVFTQVAGRAR